MVTEGYGTILFHRHDHKHIGMRSIRVLVPRQCKCDAEVAGDEIMS